MTDQSDRLYTAAQVRELDRLCIETHGIPAYRLMCRAGSAVFSAARATWPKAAHWHVVCGAGNNGGDGFVVARLAQEAGLSVSVDALCDVQRLSGAARTAAEAWREAGGELRRNAPPPETALVIDALLGTGLDRTVEGAYREVVEKINALQAPCVAADIPSGLNADTGAVMGCAVKADLTVTFIAHKRGLFTLDGPDQVGRLVLDSLGTPAAIHEAVAGSGRLDGHGLLAHALLPRPRNSHKGSFGHVLVVGGCAGMGGAARLAGEAALRSGAGLVSVATHPVHAHWLNLARPELMCHAVADAGMLSPLLERADAVAVGPGLGTDAWGRGLLEACLASAQPVVVDADGLNLLAARPRQRERWILTPHPAEAARLLGCTTAAIQADRFEAAARLAQGHDAVVVLKGCGTVIADPRGEWSVCELGNPGMATAGSGDVLTGVVAAQLAQGRNPVEAARLAVCAHAAAGDLVAEQGESGLLAGELSAALRTVLNGAYRD